MSEQIKEGAPTAVGDVGMPEELARADLYGLIARLFQLPPDQELLDQIAATADQHDAADLRPQPEHHQTPSLLRYCQPSNAP